MYYRPGNREEIVETLYFDVALMAYAVIYITRQTQLSEIPIIDIIKYGSSIVCAISSFISVFLNYKWNFSEKVFVVFLTVVSVILFVIHGTPIAFLTSCVILSAYNISFDHISSVCLKAISLVFVVVLISLALGIVEDRLYYRDVEGGVKKSYAHDLGFLYYSLYSYIVMGGIVCLLYKWREHITLERVFMLFALSGLVFILSSTRLQLYGCLMFIVGFLAIPIIPLKVFTTKLSGAFCVILYPILCFLIYFVSKFKVLHLLSNYSDLNNLLNGRLDLNEAAFSVYSYDVTLWGNKMDFDARMHSSHYFYIDSGFLHVLLENGIFFMGLLMILYSMLFYKVYKAKNFILFVFLLIYALLSIVNGLLFSLLANPLILLALSDTHVLSAQRPAKKVIVLYEQ